MKLNSIRQLILVVVVLSVGVILGLAASSHGGNLLSSVQHKGKPCGRSWISMDKTCHKPTP
jgi:hypothetical protein